MIRPLVRIVDDEESVRESVSLFLQMADFETVTYSGAREFLERDDVSRPGCMILDVRMPGMSGIELQNECRARKIDLPVIFLSAHGDIEMAVEAVHRGAADFLVKPPKPEKLLELVRKTSNQHVMRRRMAAERAALGKQYEALTSAEKEVAVLIAKGLSNAEMAKIQNVTERTVKAHRASVYQKLDAENAIEVLEFLRSAGIVGEDA